MTEEELRRALEILRPHGIVLDTYETLLAELERLRKSVDSRATKPEGGP